MADSVKVVSEDWVAIYKQITGKMEAIDNDMTEFSKILEELSTSGMSEGEASRAIKSFKGNLDKLKECLSDIENTVKSVVQEFSANVESIDHYQV